MLQVAAPSLITGASQRMPNIGLPQIWPIRLYGKTAVFDEISGVHETI